MVARSVRERGEEVRERECQKMWQACGACGHSVSQHANLGPKKEDDEPGGSGVGDDEQEDERVRRIKVAVRLDELLEEEDRLLDFEYTDEHQESLRK